MEKILSTARPIVTSFDKFAHFFSVAGEDEGHLLWLSKHWLLPYACVYKNPLYAAVDFSGYSKLSYMDNSHMSNSCLETHAICRDIMKYESAIESIKYYLNRDYYICIWINTKGLLLYPGWDIDHQVLVYGYHDEESTLYIRDFFPPSLKYQSDRIGMTDFASAYAMAKKDEIILYKKKKSICMNPYWGSLVNNLYDAAEKISSCSYRVVNPYYPKTDRLVNAAVGMDVYDAIRKDSDLYGTIGIHSLYDSKVLFAHCIEPLCRHGLLPKELYRQYLELIAILRLTRNISIKKSQKDKMGIRSQSEQVGIEKQLALAKEAEFKVLKDMMRYWNRISFV